MSYLKSISSAIRHGEILADEALDLNLRDLSVALSGGARRVTEFLERSLDLADEVPTAKKTQKMALESLAAIYADVTCALQEVLSVQELIRVTPSGHLDIAERTRYRLRRLCRFDDSEIIEIRTRMDKSLGAYEQAVDAYLFICTDAQACRERAIYESQIFRVALERAKAKLLAHAETGSDQYRRIKRRPVRTKRPRWLPESEMTAA